MPRRNIARTHTRTRGRAANATVLAVLGAAALTAAVTPTPASAAVNGTHVIAALYSTSGLELSGYGANKTLAVTASRNGATLSTATVTTDAAGDGALNGGGADCWTGTTPGILAGDTITVTGDGPDDSMVVQDVAAGRPEVDAATGDILVHGTAAPLGGVGQVPIGQLEARIVSGGGQFANGKRQLRTGNDGTIAYDAPGSTSWTATFGGRSAADQQLALAAADSRGVDVPVVSEVTISQNPAAPGPQAPCTALLAATAVGGVTPTLINLANATTDLTVSGPATADISDVTVSLPTGASHSVAPSGGTWTVTFTPAEVGALAQGSSTVTAAFTGATAPADQTRTIVKDTIAPVAPTASPAPGTYATSQMVSFNAEPGPRSTTRRTAALRPPAARPRPARSR